MTISTSEPLRQQLSRQGLQLLRAFGGKNNTIMKNIKLKLFLTATALLFLNIFAEMNYGRMQWAQLRNCGSDACIVETYKQYGFTDTDVFDDVTQLDKIEALFTATTNN